MKLHKVYAYQIGVTGEQDISTLCGLGDGGREVEFDAAAKEKDITCKSCKRMLKQKGSK